MTAEQIMDARAEVARKIGQPIDWLEIISRYRQEVSVLLACVNNVDCHGASHEAMAAMAAQANVVRGIGMIVERIA